MTWTAKDLAATLNGRELNIDVITPVEAEAARRAGLVVAFGYSDDLVELRGAIFDEVGGYKGATIPLTSQGLVENDCGEEDCPYFARIRDQATKVIVHAQWDGTSEFTWWFEAPFPHETFEILDEGEKFCRGIVFALADVEKSQCQPHI